MLYIQLANKIEHQCSVRSLNKVGGYRYQRGGTVQWCLVPFIIEILYIAVVYWLGRY